eukprot:1662162-Rhodomonas_salina.3
MRLSACQWAKTTQHIQLAKVSNKRCHTAVGGAVDVAHWACCCVQLFRGGCEAAVGAQGGGVMCGGVLAITVAVRMLHGMGGVSGDPGGGEEGGGA